MLFWVANLGLNSPDRPDPATGRAFEIQWRIAHVYVTQTQSLLVCAGLACMAVYLIWRLFLDPLRMVRRKLRYRR